MGVSFFGFTIVRASQLRILQAKAAPAQDDARALVGEQPRRGAGQGRGDPGGVSSAAVGEVIRLADGLADLTGNGASPHQPQASTVLRWVEARTRSLLDACEITQIEETGNFDPARHQAVGSRAAPTPGAAHQIADTVRPGYARHGTLLRPQQVVVYVPADQALDA